MIDFMLLPFKFWLAVLGTATESTSNPIDTFGLRRNKKQEMLRRHPELFDKDGNFISGR